MVHQQPPDTVVWRIDQQRRIPREGKESSRLTILTRTGADITHPSHAPGREISDDNAIVRTVVADEHPAVGDLPDGVDVRERLA